MKSSKLPTLLYIYILLICAWFFLWLTVGDGPWWLTVLNRIVPYLFLPVPLFFGWLLLVHEYRFAALLILPVSIFSFLYHPYIVPKYSTRSIASSDMTVMTYNVLFSNFDYDAVANVILMYHPDLVALQEILPEMMSALQVRLADEYPYSVHGTNKDYAVTAIFSCHPLSETSVLELSGNHRPVIVKAQVGDQVVTFASVHLSAYGLQRVSVPEIPQAIVERTDAQNQQVELLLEKLQDESGPVLIGCDCNSMETSSSYRILDESFDSAAHQVGWRFPGVALAGARQDTDLQHIDYIWYRGALEPVAAYITRDPGRSDHYPVLADFKFR